MSNSDCFNELARSAANVCRTKFAAISLLSDNEEIICGNLEDHDQNLSEFCHRIVLRNNNELIGALIIFDAEKKVLDEGQLNSLQNIANEIVHQFEQRVLTKVKAV